MVVHPSQMEHLVTYILVPEYGLISLLAEHEVVQNLN
jgi:hypothetical protein